MKVAIKNYLRLQEEYSRIEQAKVVILPFGYEGGVSFGKGAAMAPQAVIESSQYLELYDEILDIDPYKIGIATVEQPKIPQDAQGMIACLYDQVKRLLSQDKFVITIGGDHSISSGAFRAMHEKFGEIGCIQIDAHSDLRDEYEGSSLSHACVMARIREMTPHTCQFGIRSQCREEAEMIKQQHLDVFTMHTMRQPGFDVKRILQKLPEKVYLTLDVDAMDWSVIASTGTPEPGGFTWDELINLFEVIFNNKEVIGIDVVELSANENDRNSPFAVAKLIYKMIGFKFHSFFSIPV